MLTAAEDTAVVLLLIAVTVPLILLWVAVIVDLLRRKDLGAGKKLMWFVIVAVSVYLGVLVYFILRPIPPPAGKRDHDKDERASAIVSNIEALHVQHDAGDITDDAYLTAKRQLLGLSN